MKRLSWAEIKHKYEGQWVQLVDYEWEWESSFPRWARVKSVSTHRAELKVSDHRDPESVIVYVNPADSHVRLDSFATAL